MYFDMDCACKGRNLDKLLQPAILKSLYYKNLHGFLLIQELSENSMFRGTLPDRAGVYRYLKKMEASGLLRSDWEVETESNKPRRVYSITDEGKQCLANWSKALKAYISAVTMLVDDIDEIITK